MRLLLEVLLAAAVLAAPAWSVGPSDQACRRLKEATQRLEPVAAEMPSYLEKLPAMQACYTAAPDVEALKACRGPAYAAVKTKQNELWLLWVEFGRAKDACIAVRATVGLGAALARKGSSGVPGELEKLRKVHAFDKRVREIAHRTKTEVDEDQDRYAVAEERLKEKAGRRRLARQFTAAVLGAALGAALAARSWLRWRALPPRPGALIAGEYRLEHELGPAGQGAAFEAADTSLGRKVVLRRVDKELLREAQAAAALKHPNIAEIYAVVRARSRAYLVFERVQGRTLAQEIAAQGRLALRHARGVVRQIAAALEYAHGQGVCHGDVRSEHVIVRADGSIKVMDFGAARQAGVPASKASDILALGACAYEMLTGAKPLPGADLPAPSRVAPELTTETDAFMRRALRAEAGQGFCSALELADAFDALGSA